MKLIIEIEKDYYEIIKDNVEHGQDYKPFEIIANGVPYNPTGDSISREGLKEVINDLFRSGEYDCNSVLEAIDNAPIVTPSHKGEWARHDEWRGGVYIGGFYHVNCPCEDGYYSKWRTNFCPNCGLPMQKGDAE